MARTSPEQNKALVLEAFDVLFNRRTALRLNATGPTDISSTAPISNSAMTGCSIRFARCPTRCAMRTGSFSPRANTSSRTVVSLGVDGRRPGSLSTSSASKTASSPSIGMCFRTKRRKPSRRADSDVRRSLPGLIGPLWRDLSHRSLPRPIDRQVMPVGEARVE